MFIVLFFFLRFVLLMGFALMYLFYYERLLFLPQTLEVHGTMPRNILRFVFTPCMMVLSILSGFFLESLVGPSVSHSC